MNKIVWSLFDGSGIMGLPWAEAGYKVFCFNSASADHGEYLINMEHPNLHYVDVWINGDISQFNGYGIPSIIFAFPSCTEVAVSGAKHSRNEQAAGNAVSMAQVAQRLGDIFGCPWMVENPVGKLSTEWRKPDYYFNPHEYGGYLTEEEGSFHPKMPLCDGYTKKTCIFAGNAFIMPPKNPGHINIGHFWGWASLGGKSQKTKQFRSLTPRGFARAVFHANSTEKD